MGLNSNFNIDRLIGLGIVLLLFTLTFGGSLRAQDSLVKPMPLHLSEGQNFEEKDSALLKKILRPFRFKDNRNRKERERMYQYIKELVKEGELKIDTTNVEEVMKLLVQLQDSLNRGDVEDSLGTSLDSIGSESDKVEKAPLTDEESLDNDLHLYALLVVIVVGIVLMLFLNRVLFR